MIVISGNIRDILKRCRGLFINVRYKVGGFVCKRVNMKGLFGKRVIMGGVSLANRAKVGGFWAKRPSLSSPRAGK